MTCHETGHRLQFRHIVVENVETRPKLAANLP
jgi:hypothetical protein